MSAERRSAHSTRLIIDRAAPRANDDFAADVRAGLSFPPRRLPPKYFYDQLGSQLFEAITLLPEYYLTRAETEILGRSAAEMVDLSGGRLTLVELGSGSAVKTRLLIEALLARQGELHYQPIDISASALESSARALLEDYPRLRITAREADYTQHLAPPARDAERALALFLGSNIGNYEPGAARALLASIRGSLAPGDALLLGADLRKEAAVLEAAYDDALGVTSAFNRNVLARINRELGGEFDLKRFAHRARYDASAGRVEIHLESLAEQRVRIRSLDLALALGAGELIHTENSYKYDREQLSALAAAAGFTPARWWTDAGERFACSLWLVAE
jgi:L-histidine N-alpha-methyltransferase